MTTIKIDISQGKYRNCSYAKQHLSSSTISSLITEVNVSILLLLIMPSIKIIKAEVGGLSGKNGHYLDHVSKKSPFWISAARQLHPIPEHLLTAHKRVPGIRIISYSTNNRVKPPNTTKQVISQHLLAAGKSWLVFLVLGALYFTALPMSPVRGKRLLWYT